MAKVILKPASPAERRALVKFTARHGLRVRRQEAMQLLNIKDKCVFKKVVDANPAIKHSLLGEGQTKYLTTVIFDLLPSAVRCATCGEEM